MTAQEALERINSLVDKDTVRITKIVLEQLDGQGEIKLSVEYKF